MAVETSHAPTSTASVNEVALEVAWSLCLALAAWRRDAISAVASVYRLSTADPARPQLVATGDNDPRAVVRWLPDQGWLVAEGWPVVATDLLNLYWPMIGAGTGLRLASGHLGQSLDGRIATRDGHSQSLSCPQNLNHLHRMRALADAVIIGAITAATDNPQLTTRRVPGPSPVRVVLDPSARLPTTLGLFNDNQAPTLVVCANDHQKLAESRWGRQHVIAVPYLRKRLDVAVALTRLHELGLSVVFVEGGGITVSRFVEADCLDRLQIAIAPVLLGAGRDGIQLPAAARIPDGLRPVRRVYQMGGDVMWDFDLRSTPPSDEMPAPARLVRIG